MKRKIITRMDTGLKSAGIIYPRNPALIVGEPNTAPNVYTIP